MLKQIILSVAMVTILFTGGSVWAVSDGAFDLQTSSQQDDTILFNVPINRGGVEVFPMPDRASGRLFAVLGDFAPHVGGKNAAGDWILIYYFERDGSLESAWSPARQFLAISEEDAARLAVIDPANLPALPDLPIDAGATRPVRTTSAATSGASSATSGTAVPEQNGTAPIIRDTFVSGVCRDILVTVDWTDADGDAVALTIEGEGVGIGNSSGELTPSGGWKCSANHCTFEVILTDAAGNRAVRGFNAFCEN